MVQPGVRARSGSVRLRLDTGPTGATALFSRDDLHRYTLTWPVPDCRGIRRLVACGLNPSTANAFQTDPTVRRDIGFAQDWGMAWLVKVNAYAWRDTDPYAMWRAEKAGRNIVGEHNDDAIRCALTQMKRDGGIALACWGNHVKQTRALQLVRIAAEIGVEWQCVGVNQNGSPRHTLYVRGDSTYRPWSTKESK